MLMDEVRNEHWECFGAWRLSPMTLWLKAAVDICADIVEGMVNKGIFLKGDNGGTFLHFGNYQNSCISDPSLCGPEGE